MPQLTRREMRPLLALLLVGALPLGIAGYFTYSEADPHIQLPPRPAPPAPNGFDLYVKAADLSAQPNPPVDASSDSNSPNITAAQGAIRYGRARRQAWHDAAAPAWATFRRAQQTPTRDPYPYGAQAMPGYARLRELARNKSAETRLFMLRGEPDKAVASALDCVEMAFDISTDGAMISRLVASAICAIGIVPLSDPAANSVQTPEQLTGPQARAAAARLEALLARRPSYIDAAKKERWVALGMLDKAFKRGNWRAPDAFNSDLTSSHDEIGDTIVRALISKRAVVANVNRGFDYFVAEMKAPYTTIKRVPIAGPMIVGAATNQVAPRATFDPISAQFVPGPHLNFNAAREKTQLDLLLLRFALQAYRADKGAYPPNLNALAPAYLRQIPTDDFAVGKPYNYKLTGPNYRLWSVGPDGVNDGGKAIGLPASPAGIPAPPAPTLPWQKVLPAMQDDSLGDAVAGETR